MSNNFISKGQRNVCVTFVKYYPVLNPVKIKGFPKPLYTKVMLDEAIKTISGMSERDIYMRILNAKSRESRAKERRGV